MPSKNKIQEAEDLQKELQAIEQDSIDLFKSVPLIPESHKIEEDGKVVEMNVLRWHMNDIQAVKSRELALRYEAWSQKTATLVEKYMPYQSRAFAEVRAIMESYVTLNRYAVATDKMLESANKENEKGYVSIYLVEFASVIKSQANIVQSIVSLPEQILLPQPRCFMTGSQCTIKVWLNPNLVFVIMPFAKEFNDVYLLGIKDVVQGLNLECTRSDEVVHTKNILCVGICQPIRSARFVIAELTDRNPNVLYELGFSHSFEKDVILITREIEHVPFDLRNQNVVVYENVSDLRKKLGGILQKLVNI